MGSYQLLLMNTDAYAAVDTSVNLVRSVAGVGAVGLVNAVLRKVSGHTRDRWISRLSKDRPGSDEQLALDYSHPPGLSRRLRDSLGARNADQLPDLLDANNEPAVVTWRHDPE